MRAAPALVLAMLVLAACKPFGGGADADGGKSLPMVGQEKQKAEQFACEAKGGRWADLNGGFVCQFDTKDAGKECTASSQCEGGCLAKSRTCSPIRPLLGCNEVLTDNGMVMQTCVQ